MVQTDASRAAVFACGRACVRACFHSTCSNMKANSTLSLGTLLVSRKQYSLK